MYTIDGKFIKSLPKPKKLEPIEKNKNKEKIIEHMDNATASFNTLQLHDKYTSVFYGYIGSIGSLAGREKYWLSTGMGWFFFSHTDMAWG